VATENKTQASKRESEGNESLLFSMQRCPLDELAGDVVDVTLSD